MDKTILIKPVVSEKTTDASELMDQYSFYVDLKANKFEIKQAVEEMYGVTVLKVRTLVKRPRNLSRFTKNGLQIGRTNRMKKAIVTIEAGQEIDLFS